MFCMVSTVVPSSRPYWSSLPSSSFSTSLGVSCGISASSAFSGVAVPLGMAVARAVGSLGASSVRKLPGVVAAPSGSRASSCTRLSGSAGSTRSTFSCSLSTSQLPEYSILKRSTAGCTRMITVPGAWRVTTATSRYGICANSWSDFSLVEKPYRLSPT